MKNKMGFVIGFRKNAKGIVSARIYRASPLNAKSRRAVIAEEREARERDKAFYLRYAGYAKGYLAALDKLEKSL
jgi:hypothetical protein